MRNKIALISILISGVSCSAPDQLEIPIPRALPSNWASFSMSTIPGTDCPKIEGTYLDPPDIYRSSADLEDVPKDNLNLYSSYVPFHRAERRELSLEDQNMSAKSFIIRQPSANEFYFTYFAERIKALVEYHFQSSEGDFICIDGYIEFPHFTSYGMIEGVSMNFQIRNMMLKDDTGALIIQSTRGPYRKYIMKSKNTFSDEIYRYQMTK